MSVYGGPTNSKHWIDKCPYSTTMKCNIEEKLTQYLQNECLYFYSYQIIPVDLTVARTEQFRILSKVR